MKTLLLALIIPHGGKAPIPQSRSSRGRGVRFADAVPERKGHDSTIGTIGSGFARGAQPWGTGVSPARQEPPAGLQESLRAVKSPALDLRVRFFGDFEVFCRGEPLDLGQNNKVIAIFKCLLARRGRPVSQDMLMGWLWPESSPKKARWSLNSAVYVLRRTLDEESPDANLSDCIILKRGHYRLTRDLWILSDVEEFDAHYERGRLLERTKKQEDAASEYEKAIALYRGDYLVEDLYEDWTTIERERLTSAYVDVRDRLATYYTQAGNLQKSIAGRYLLLEKDPYHEESYRALMRCYARLGIRGRTLRQYELCKRRLKHLYDISPAPETRILHEKLLAGEEI